MAMSLATPLRRRPVDALYVVFFVSHLIFSLALDTQALFPKHYFPEVLQHTLGYYQSTTNDPMFRSGVEPWFKTFLWVEFLFQCPVFILGAIGLAKGDRRVWPLLAAYGAHAATTTLACLATVLADQHVTREQRTMLLCSYVPYFVIPSLLSVDMVWRMTKHQAFPTVKAKNT